MNITVVGAGISGLSAAFELQRSGYEVTLLEESDRLGGKILTTEIEGFNIDAGPDSFLTRDPEMRELCFALGVSRICPILVWHILWDMFSMNSLKVPPRNCT